MVSRRCCGGWRAECRGSSERVQSPPPLTWFVYKTTRRGSSTVRAPVCATAHPQTPNRDGRTGGSGRETLTRPSGTTATTIVFESEQSSTIAASITASATSASEKPQLLKPRPSHSPTLNHNSTPPCLTTVVTIYLTQSSLCLAQRRVVRSSKTLCGALA